MIMPPLYLTHPMLGTKLEPCLVLPSYTTSKCGEKMFGKGYICEAALKGQWFRIASCLGTGLGIGLVRWPNQS